MTETWCYYELKEGALTRKGYSFPPFPVRCQRVREIFGTSKVDLLLLLKELNLFLIENPEYRDRYREAIHFIAQILLFDLGEKEGNDEQKMEIIQIGLTYNPMDDALQINRAIVLHSSLKYPEALYAYRKVMERSSPESNPLLWILVAHLHAETCEYRKAYETLFECSPYILKDFKEFWDFLEDMEEKQAAIKKDFPPGNQECHCPHCNAPLPSSAKFCRRCGNPVNTEATRS
mgnify:CR=1 FL=1